MWRFCRLYHLPLAIPVTAIKNGTINKDGSSLLSCQPSPAATPSVFTKLAIPLALLACSVAAPIAYVKFGPAAAAAPMKEAVAAKPAASAAKKAAKAKAAKKPAAAASAAK